MGGKQAQQVTNYRRMDSTRRFNQINEGQLFFNSTTNTFKETIKDVPGGTWASGGSLNTARYRRSMEVLDLITAGIFLVVTPSSTQTANNRINIMEQAWTEVNDLNTARGNDRWRWNTNSSHCSKWIYSQGLKKLKTETWNGSKLDRN